MNHEQAFLQAIRETPHDDAPRLIYADWLEEHGGAARAARADFIRIQCRLDEMPEDDPARDRLEDEAADLLAEHEAEWTQPLHGIAEDWRFSRGFLEHIRIRGENLLTHAERLFDFAPLRSLHLLIPRNDVPYLAACQQLRWVQMVDFTRCQLNDRSLQQLLSSSYLDRLSELNLNGNEINTPGIRALIHSPLFARLQRLDLSRNRALGDTAVRLLAHEKPADSLEVLGLAGINLTVVGLYVLFEASRLSRLSCLNISGISRARFDHTAPQRDATKFKMLAQLQRLDMSELRGAMMMLCFFMFHPSAKLHSLYLRGVEANSLCAQLLEQLPCLANLTVLDLSRNYLGSNGVQTLAGFPHLASLKHLDVSHNDIRDTGAKAVIGSPHLRRLRALNFNDNGIGGPGLKGVAESANLDPLISLQLAGNFIGADSVRALAESTHLRKLTCLNLSEASVEEESARILAASANLARLTTLLLQKNRLGDGGAKALAQSPHLARLTTLDLSDNRIGKAGAEALAAASWQRMRNLDLRGNVFTDTEEALLRNRFGNAVQL